jgi:N-acetylglucosaminyldiphosphoundecaprenol N-acetyl-beta-D-mannosaminyltransferase
MSDIFLLSELNLFNQELQIISNQKLLISTINAYSYNLAQKDIEFAESLYKSDILLPDGISIVYSKYFLTGKKINKIAGADLFHFELNRLNKIGGKCFFLGSTDGTLCSIVKNLTNDFPAVIVQTYSPPFKKEFSIDDNKSMIRAINTFDPDVLFIGMTAPKQEKWAYSQFNELSARHICCIGAVFDFYAGTVKRAPLWMIRLGFEWLYRLLKEPKRMWKRYLIGNVIFVFFILKEKFKISKWQSFNP